MTYGELVDRVIEVTGLSPEDASKVATEIHGAERMYTESGIRYIAHELGFDGRAEEPVQAPARTFEQAFGDLLERMHLEPDPAQVLKHVYRECPRLLPKQDGHVGVYPPRIGRAPKESVFYTDELRAAINELPEEVRLLIGRLDLYDGSLTITLYDEANDVDRHIGPIDLARYESANGIHDAIMELLGRLPRVIAADWN